MKRRKLDASEERTALTGMIANDVVLDTIARNLKGEKRPFRSKWSNLVAKWCLEHWRKYRTAPRGSIETRFARFADANHDDETVGLVETFLQGLSDDLAALGDEMNAQFVIDTASRYFNEVRLERLAHQITDSLQNKDVAAATEAYHSHEPVEFIAGQHPDPFDPEQQKKWLSQEDSESMIEFPGPLGDFLNDGFQRDSFISFAGPEKRGKSWWLLETVWQAIRNRRRVLYYVVGDMSEKQAMIRLLCRVARLPRHSKELTIPTEIVEKKERIIVRTKQEELKGITPAIAEKVMSRVLVKTATKEPRLKSRINPSSTITASDIESEIVDLARNDWVPDVVVIDYADVLAPEVDTRQMDYRHQQNETWKVLRRISQRFHLCLVTATQTAASSYDKDIIRKGDFSEDKRKGGHVTGMIGINQTPDEKKEGLYRLNWIFLRDGFWSDNQVVYTAGNLAISRPCVVSSLF